MLYSVKSSLLPKTSFSFVFLLPLLFCAMLFLVCKRHVRMSENFSLGFYDTLALITFDCTRLWLNFSLGERSFSGHALPLRLHFISSQHKLPHLCAFAPPSSASSVHRFFLLFAFLLFTAIGILRQNARLQGMERQITFPPFTIFFPFSPTLFSSLRIHFSPLQIGV